MENTILGQDSIIPLQYDPAILSPMSRLDSRIKNGLNEFSDFHGMDFWTSTKPHGSMMWASLKIRFSISHMIATQNFLWNQNL